MSNRPPNERGPPGPGGSPHDASSSYKRARPQSPSSSGIPALPRGGAFYPQDPSARFAMTAAALGVPSYHHPYRTDQFQQSAAEQYRASSSRDVELLQIHKQRRPTMLDYPHGQHTQAGVDRSNRFRQEAQPTYGQHYGRQDNMGNLQPHHTGPQAGMSSTPDPGPQTPKRPRLTAAMERPDLMQPLRIDTSQTEPAKREPAYNPQVEAISPTLPPEETLKAQKIKEEISEKLNLVEREIAIAKQQIQTKKKKLQQQEEAANKEKEEEDKKEETPDTGQPEIKHQSIAQIIYAENRKKAEAAHHVFSKMGPKITAPLYNQPSDTEIYHINKKKFQEFKPRLILYFKKRHQARRIRERYLTQRYDQLMQVWMKKVEKVENNPKRKAKEAKIRECYEKVFPELKKARDDKDRLSRFGGRGGSAMAQYARSEAELEQIMDGLNEQAEEERKMRALAVIPPMMLDARQRSLRFVNNNGLMEDPMEEYKERRYINIWTATEKQIFKEKYLQHPKNFALISSFLEKKTTMDCVQYYYLSKKSENYKGLLRKQSVKKKRQMAKPQAARTQEDSKEAVAAEIQSTQEPPPAEEEAINIVSSGPSIPPLRPDTGPLNIPGSGCPMPPTPIKEEEDTKDGADDSCSDIDNQAGAEMEGGVHQCAVCKTQLEHFGLSRPLTQANCELYGIAEMDLKPEMRVCNNCRCKSVNKKYKQCPVLGCKTPKRKVKRLRPLPAKWTELSARNDPVLKELQLTEDIVKCCSACFNRIARKLGTAAMPTEPENPIPDEGPGEQPEQSEAADSAEEPKWADEEIQLITKGLLEHGRDWAAVSNVVGTKNESQCKNFFMNCKKQYNLEAAVEQHRLKTEGDGRTVSMCESIATTMTATSDVENNFSEDEDNRMSDDSGTASAPSPSPLPTDDKDDKVPEVEKMEIQGSSTSEASAQPSVEIPNNLTSHKPLSTSHGSLRSIPDNDSSATLSADEDTRPHSDRHGPHAGSIPVSALPVCSTGPNGSRVMSPHTSGIPVTGQRMPPAPQQGPQIRPHASPAASPGNSNQSFPGSRPGSRMSPASQGHQGMSRPNSRPSSHEVPIIREANTTSGQGSQMDFPPQQPMKSYSPYPGMSGREAQPHRPSSTLSEPGLPTHRAVSPHVQGIQVSALLGLDPNRALSPHASSLNQGDKKAIRSSTCVRDLIHSAIERNLNSNSVERPPDRQPERPRSSTESGYRPGGQMGPQTQQVDLRATDLRKDRPDPRMDYQDPRAMYQQMPGRGVDRSPREAKDPRDFKVHDLTVEKGAQGYKGDPRDFDPHGQHRPGDPYSRPIEDPQQRKVIPMVTPPPAHSHRRSPFQDAMVMKGRQEGLERAQAFYPDRQTLSPSVRGLPPSTSPYNPMAGDPRVSKGVIGGIPPPPPLINTSSPRLPRSPPGGQHMQNPPTGSITHGTPISHPLTTTIPTSSVRHYEHGQQIPARGSITQGTPIRESQLGRGSPMGHEGRPRAPGQYDIRMVEQAQVRGIVPQVYDPRLMEQMRMQHPHYQQGNIQQYSGPYPPTQPPQGGGEHSKQLTSDFELARQMRHQTSPMEKDVQRSSPRAQDHGQSPTQKGYHIDPRMALDSRYHAPASGGMFVPPQLGQPSSSRISPRPSPNMPSPRDDKNASPWMMAQRPHMQGSSPGAHPGGHPSGHPSPHMEQSHQYPTPAQGRPSITQGTGRQTVITDSRGDERYVRAPDSSSSHHSPRLPEGYPTSSGDHRPSPGTHPDMYRQQQQPHYEKIARGQEEAVKEARTSYEQGLKKFMKQQVQDGDMRPTSMPSREDVQYKKQMYSRPGEMDQNKQSPKLSTATDLFKAFAPDQNQKRREEPAVKGKGVTTAANLIDAIIAHQINQTTEETVPSESQPVSAQSKTDGNQPEQQRPVMSQAMSGQQSMQQQMQGQSPQCQQLQVQGHPGQQVQGQGHPGQQVQGYPGQQGQQLQPQQASKRRWIPQGASSTTGPGGPGSYPPGTPPKSEGDNRVASSTSSTPEARVKDEKKLWSIPMPGASGDQSSSTRQMTLGDHINSIILLDYERKEKQGPPGPGLLSQINGSLQQTGALSSQTVTSTVPSLASVEMPTSWSTSPLSSTTPSLSPGSADSQGKSFPPAHKKFKWRQTSEQASSSGEPVEGSGAVTQSSMDESGSRQSSEGDWKQMKPDQSSVHSPGVAASSGLPPVSPQGQPDSSSSVSASSNDARSIRKGLGVQDSEVSTLEYVNNKIAQVLHDANGPGKGHGQMPEQGQQIARGQQHLQVPAQQNMLQGRQRAQSPVSSQGMIQKEPGHKYPRQGLPPGDPLMSGIPMRPDMQTASSSSSALSSPDQHQLSQEQQSQVQSSVSSASNGREQVHSSQHAHPLSKKRMFSRPRSRAEQEEAMAKGPNAGPREPLKPSPRASPSAVMHESGRMPQPSDKKGPRSAYDFPDSPDDEALGKPSSYMALSSTTRSPRRGIVDSSENRSQSGGDSARDDDNVESSGDIGYYESKVSDSGSTKDNEAQGFERYSSEQREQTAESSFMAGDQGRGNALQKQSLEADEGSNISQTSADSTDKLMIEETASIDSSSAEVTSISHKATGSRRSSKSSRESDTSPHPGSEYTGMTEHVSHSRQGHRSRSPRSYPHSSSDLPTSMASNISAGFGRRMPDSESQHEQEPQPLLSSQYETLSDEEN